MDQFDQTERPAAFFDRDGVLNHDYGYVHRPEDFRWIDGAKESILACNRAGFFVFVVTNQSGIGRGLYSAQEVRDLHNFMRRDLQLLGAEMDDFAFCPHHPEALVPEFRRICECRKPAPGMILELLRKWPVRRSGSFLVGDKESDLQAAAAAGINGFLYRGSGLLELVRSLLNGEEKPG